MPRVSIAARRLVGVGVSVAGLSPRFLALRIDLRRLARKLLLGRVRRAGWILFLRIPGHALLAAGVGGILRIALRRILLWVLLLHRFLLMLWDWDRSQACVINALQRMMFPPVAHPQISQMMTSTEIGTPNSHAIR